MIRLNETVSGRGLRGEHRGGFTLIELLVVVAIIALLVAILLPALGSARKIAATSVSLSNLRQIGIGLKSYTTERRGFYPMHSSPSSQKPRTRWVDELYTFMKSTEIFMSPLLEPEELERMSKPFAHTVDQTTGAVMPSTIYFGGYGYNFQYLGNSRGPAFGVPTWHNNEAKIQAPASMVAVGDTRGSKKGSASNPYGINGEAVYVIDPPLGSGPLGSNGSRSTSNVPGPGNAYYTGGSDGDENHRSMPGDRNYNQQINYAFADGRAESMTREEVDQISTAHPIGNNALWNGEFDRDKK